jgi:predicted CxxxxCH...CXXCH cytochrome family protein
MDSGSHTPHLGVGGVTCDTCHAGNTHVNKNIDVTTGTYSQAPNPPGNGYGACSTASCHDDGTGASVATPTWGTAVNDCSECHAKQPATASHTKHLTGLTAGFNRNAVCGDCHDGAVEGTTAPSTHGDDNVDVFDSLAGDLGYPTTVAKGGAPYNNCTTAYCHSNGLSAFATVTWGNLSTGCNFCHSNLPATGAHGKHVKTAATSYGSTSASTTGGNNDFGCGNCHPVSITNHMNGSVDILLTDGVLADPLKDLNAPTAGKTGTGATTVCNLTYCHSDGTKTGAAIVAGASPQWGAVFSGDSCAMCHGNSPATGSHPTHVMAGIHYDNIYTGTTGLAAMGNTATGAHGNAATATTINCNICHNATVTSAANDKNAACSSCHTGTPMGNAAIAAASVKHLDGAIQVELKAGAVLSKAQIRGTTSPTDWTRITGYKVAGAYDSATINVADWTAAGKTCTTACHLGNASPAWGTPATCYSCHTALP